MLVRVTTTLVKNSSPKKDDAKNVFHIYNAAAYPISGAQGLAWSARVIAFYNGIAPYLSASLSRAANAQTITLATVTTNAAGADDDVVGTNPLLYTFTLAAANTGANVRDLPPELAICLSHTGYQNSPGEGPKTGPRPAARRRGRVYLGPLNSSTSQTNLGLSIDNACCDNISFQWKTMVDGIRATVAPNGGDVGIYSPTSDTFWPDQKCHVDNAFDIVNSRGVAADFRSEKTMFTGNQSGIVGGE